jgi:hypothetical protein
MAGMIGIPNRFGYGTITGNPPFGNHADDFENLLFECFVHESKGNKKMLMALCHQLSASNIAKNELKHRKVKNSPDCSENPFL